MKHLIVITATYGTGEAPTNATKFKTLFQKNIAANNIFSYAVIGFGSLAYPDFCKFAMDVDMLIGSSPKSTQLLPMHTVNNKSFESFSIWVNSWAQKVNLTMTLAKEKLAVTKHKTSSFKVVGRFQTMHNENDTYLLLLESIKNKKYRSGDILAIYPKGDSRARLYSIGAMTRTNSVQLSIKRHKKGICSNYLNDIEVNGTIEGYIVKNPEFHFPKKSNQVIMICTGTGIGPFLGMLENNTKYKEIYMYYGDKNENAYELYKDKIEEAAANNKLSRFVPAYSKSTVAKVYVQDLIQKDADFIATALKNKGVIMICGAITMQKDVITTLGKICAEKNGKPLSYYQNKSQIKMDCY